MNPSPLAVRASLVFAYVSSLAAQASAEVCDQDTQPASCHIVEPHPDITFADGVVMPALHDTSLFWDSDRVVLDPQSVEAGIDVAEGGLELRLGAGGWGSGGQEPLVLARSNFRHLLGGPDVQWIFPLNSSRAEQWGEGCTPGTSLCYTDTRVQQSYIWRHASASIYRMVRITQTNPAPLPASVTHVPVLVDYRLAVYSEGPLSPALNGDFQAPVGGTATVTIGHFADPLPPAGTYTSKRAHCVSRVDNGQQVIRCIDEKTAMLEGVEGREHSGTISHLVPLGSLDAIQLRIAATSQALLSPICFDQETTYGTICVFEPLVGSGHAVADPYVYVDPDWEYASWFQLQIAADETDATWATPVRRAPLDLETLMPIAEADAGVGPETDAGGGDLDAGLVDGSGGKANTTGGNSDASGGDANTSGGDANTTDGGDAGLDGDASSDGAGPEDAGCGCRVGPGTPTRGSAAWLSAMGLAAAAAALLRRRRG